MKDWPITALSDHGNCPFEALAGSVLSLDAGIVWIAVEEAGRRTISSALHR